MPHQRNSALRLHAFISALPHHADNTQVLSAWAKALAVETTDGNRQARLVTEQLSLLANEIDFVRHGMTQADFSQHLYASALSAMEAALSPMQLPGTWNSVRQYFKPEHLLALQFCSEILPDEEDEISQEDLSTIQALVAELEELANRSSDIPIRLRQLLLNQTANIRGALAGYRIAGAKALRDAVRSSYGELVEAKDVITAHKDSPEVSKLAEVWRKVNTVADTALKVDGFAQLGHRVWLFIESVIKGAA
jgi:hypothetical protein